MCKKKSSVCVPVVVASLSLPEEGFGSSEAAWFWFMACYAYRQSHAHKGFWLEGDHRYAFEPLDILCIIERLFNAGVLSDAHMRILVRFGRLGRPPAVTRDGERVVRLWRQALATLAAPMRQKGIIKDDL